MQRRTNMSRRRGRDSRRMAFVCENGYQFWMYVCLLCERFARLSLAPDPNYHTRLSHDCCLISPSPPFMCTHCLATYNPDISMTDIILQGYGYKMGSMLFSSKWERKYFVLFPNRFMWADSLMVSVREM